MSIEEIRARAEAAARKGEIYRTAPYRIMAVTKTQTPERINALPEWIDLIGENRVQELLEKQENVSSRFETHFIGQLQSNKVKYIVDKVSLIHSVDRWELAEQIDRRCAALQKRMQVLIEVNIGGESTKGGVAPTQVYELCRRISGLSYVEPVGLMCVARLGSTEKEARQQFSAMRELLENCRRDHPRMCQLSMGMSNDYEIALEEGATIVRLGTALFGKREYK